MASGHTCTTAATMKEEHYLECCLALGSRKLKVANAIRKVIALVTRPGHIDEMPRPRKGAPDSCLISDFPGMYLVRQVWSKTAECFLLL